MSFLNSSKLLTPKSFSISITWWIFFCWLLSLSLTLTELFQNHVEWILPAFFNCLHYLDNNNDSSWFSLWHMLTEMKSLPEKFSWVRTSDLLWRLFLLIRMLRFCFVHLNLTVIVSFFSNGDMLEDHQVSPRGRLGTMPCKRCFQEDHHQ